MKFKSNIVKQGNPDNPSVYILVPKYIFENGELRLKEGENYWIDVTEFKGGKRGK